MAGDDAYLTEEMVQRSVEIDTKFFKKKSNLKVAYANKRAEVENQTRAIGKLSQGISHFHTSLSQRNQRKGLPESSLEVYRMPKDRGRLQGRTPKRVIQLGHDRIEGDALAVNRKQDAMVNPSAADIQELVDAAELTTTAINNADRTFQNAESEIKEMRWEVETLRQDMVAQFRKTTRELEPPAQRRIMRRYGFVFTNNPENQVLDPELETPLAENQPNELETVAVQGDPESGAAELVNAEPGPKTETEAPEKVEIMPQNLNGTALTV